MIPKDFNVLKQRVDAIEAALKVLLYDLTDSDPESIHNYARDILALLEDDLEKISDR